MRRPSRLQMYLFPHKRNGFKPHIFRAASIAALALGIIVLEGAYLAQVYVVQPNTNFLATVLPATLTMLTNDDRAKNALPAVTQNEQLAQAAQLAADDMAAKGYFAHVSPDGKNPWYWLKKVGYKYEYSGQNLAVNFSDSEQVESAWMNSPTHKANIVKPQYTEIGIGVANGTYEGKEATFVVQYFASPGASAPESKSVPVTRPATRVLVQATAPKPQAPKSAVAIANTAASTAPASTAVETAIPKAPSSHTVALRVTSAAAGAATSPMQTMLYVLAGIAGMGLFLLITAVTARMSAPYLEVIGGGLVVVCLCIGLIWFNMSHAPKVQVTQESAQSTQ